MSRTKELVALADWGYQYGLISHSPLLDIPVFLQQSCFGSKNAAHDVPAAPLRILLETADVHKKSQMLWAHLCVLLQFWMDKAGYSEGNIFYGGMCREASGMVQYVMMWLNNRTRGETLVTWRDVVRGTPWLDVRMEFSVEQQAAFRLQPAPSEPNELEKEMEAWWQVCMLRKKCAAPPAAPSSVPPGAPPNTPATDRDLLSPPGLQNLTPTAWLVLAPNLCRGSRYHLQTSLSQLLTGPSSRIPGILWLHPSNTGHHSTSWTLNWATPVWLRCL